jgi:transcriptional regulator with XRE-family HTH domain
MKDNALKKWRIDIRTRMLLNKITATSVANKMGVSVQFVSSALTGYRASISEEKRKKIADTVDELIAQG